MLTIEQLHVSYDGRVVLDGLDLHIAAGEVVGLIGENGAGKSTLLDAACGLIRPQSGRICIGHGVITGYAHHRIASLKLLRSFQKPRVFERMTVQANVAGHLPLSAAGAWLDRLGLLPIADRLCLDLATAERRLVELARLGTTQPRIVLLDEPAACLDTLATALVMDAVRTWSAAGVACLIVEHRSAVIYSIADRVVELTNGRCDSQCAVAARAMPSPSMFWESMHAKHC